MFKNSVKAFSFVFLGCVFLFVPKLFGGIEIGNTYVNPNGLFKTIYPQDWTVVENGEGAKFSPQISIRGKSAQIQIEAMSSLNQVNCLKDLEKELLLVYPNSRPHSVTANGAVGFVVKLEKWDVTYFLGDSGRVYRMINSSPTLVPKLDEAADLIRSALIFLAGSEILH
jgi:hypothetical protein